jgi:hypothetical protein
VFLVLRRNCLGWGDASMPEAAAAGSILPQLPLNLARRKRATTKFPAYALALLLCVARATDQRERRCAARLTSSM